MDVVTGILTFVADNIFGQVPILIGLITLAGLLLQRKRIEDVVGGALRATIGVVVLFIGVEVFTGGLSAFQGVLASALGTTPPRPGRSLTDFLAEQGGTVALVITAGFLLHVLLVRLLPAARYRYLTGHLMFWVSAVTVGMLSTISPGADQLTLVLCGAGFVAAYWTLQPLWMRPLMRRVAPEDRFGYGHTSSLTCVLTGLLAKPFGSNERHDTERLRAAVRRWHRDPAVRRADVPRRDRARVQGTERPNYPGHPARARRADGVPGGADGRHARLRLGDRSVPRLPGRVRRGELVHADPADDHAVLRRRATALFGNAVAGWRGAVLGGTLAGLVLAGGQALRPSGRSLPSRLLPPLQRCPGGSGVNESESSRGSQGGHRARTVGRRPRYRGGGAARPAGRTGLAAVTVLCARDDVPADEWRTAVSAAAGALVDLGAASADYPAACVALVERHGPYIVLAPGLALVHARPEDGGLAVGVAATRLRHGVHFGHPSNDPVDLLLAFCTPDAVAHVTALSRLAGALSGGLPGRLRAAPGVEGLTANLKEAFR